jgi:hypothetical protein
MKMTTKTVRDAMEFRVKRYLDERTATIRLIKAHAVDSERKGAKTLSLFLQALISELEDEIQYDEDHIRKLIEG